MGSTNTKIEPVEWNPIRRWPETLELSGKIYGQSHWLCLDKPSIERFSKSQWVKRQGPYPQVWQRDPFLFDIPIHGNPSHITRMRKLIEIYGPADVFNVTITIVYDGPESRAKLTSWQFTDTGTCTQCKEKCSNCSKELEQALAIISSDCHRNISWKLPASMTGNDIVNFNSRYRVIDPQWDHPEQFKWRVGERETS